MERAAGEPPYGRFANKQGSIESPSDPEMSRMIALYNAIGFFVVWILVLLAGADKPPPLGFLWIVAVVAVCAAVVYWRVPT